MTKRAIATSLVVVCAMASTIVAHATWDSQQRAQRRRRPNAAPQPSRASTAVQLGEFDPSLAALPAGYQGDSVQLLMERASVSDKGEFETSAEYEARLAKISLAGTYAFPLRTAISYDADAEAFVVAFLEDYGTYHGFDLAYNERSIPLVEDSSETEYVASNAFGAKTVVKERNSLRYALVMEGKPSSAKRFHRLRVPVSRADAPLMKGRLRALAVTKVPYGAVVFSGYQHTRATFQSPNEHTTMHHYLRGSVLSIWVFDAATGKVCLRTDGIGEPEL